MFHFTYFNGFLTTAGEEIYCPSRKSGVVKGKNVHFVNKVSEPLPRNFLP